MAYTVNMWTFSKKRNSTAQPTGDGTVFSCKIKDGSGILNPTLILDFRGIVGVEPQNLNYAYISEFSRYYFVSEWSYVLGLWECYLTVDVLASWKSTISGITTYVYRANTGTPASGFIDNQYPYTTYHDTVNAFAASNPFSTQISNGTYILGLTGQGAGIGGVTYVAMSHSCFSDFASQLFNNTNWLSITDITDNLQKALINPLQYIQSIQWFPIPYTSIPGTVATNLNFAWWSFTLQSHKVLNTTAGGTYVTGSWYITLPKHPAYSTYGREMLLSPASHYTVIILPFGQWDIDPLDLVSTDRLVCSYVCDLITGQAFLLTGAYEFDGDQYQTRWFDSRQAKMGVTVGINQSTQDVLGIGTSVVAGAAAIAAGGATAVLGGLGAVTSAAERIAPKSSTSGGQGNTAFYNILPQVIGQFLYPSSRDYTLYGTPVFESRTLSGFSGYIQCHGIFDGPCYDKERDEINSYLESGFFYE